MTMYVSPVREPLITGNKSYTDVTNDITRPIEGKPGKFWYLGLSIAVAALMSGLICMFITVKVLL